MVTIFTIPKPFKDHINIIQRNAIKSWMQLRPTCEIILFGDDEGVSETAKELGVINIPTIDKNEFGTPLLNSTFNLAQQHSSNDILVYVNTDIIFFQDLISTIKNINIPLYLISGRRWDLDIKEEIDFANNEWHSSLLDKLKLKGIKHGLSGMDYFIFPNNIINMLPFAVGRPGWDAWLIYDMRSKRIPVIDATRAITIIHQNHDFSHSQYRIKNYISGPEYKKNIDIAGGLKNMLTLRDANFIIDKNGLKHPNYPRRIFSLFSLFYPWRLLKAIKRKLILELEIKNNK